MNPPQAPTVGITAGRQRVRQFVGRHPLITFLAVFNTFGQAVAFVPVIARARYGIELNTDLILIIPTLLFLLLPALVITRISRGPEGLRSLLRSMVRFQIQWRWYLLPLLVMPALALAVTLSVPPGGLNAKALIAAYLTAYLPALLFQFITTNWWEETAWMGAIQAPLQQRFGPWRAVLLTRGRLDAPSMKSTASRSPAKRNPKARNQAQDAPMRDLLPRVRRPEAG